MNEELGKNAAAEVQPASQGCEVQRDLLEALNQMYYAVLRIAPEEDAVTVLQSRDHPENVGKKLQWSAYLEHYRSMLTENGKKKLQERLSCQALQAAAKSKGEGRPGFTLEVSYSAGGRTNWLTMPVLIKQTEDGDTAVYVFVRKSNDEHLLKSIIDLYVYNTCDYFIYLNAKNNSYVMFSGSDSGTPLPPAAGDDYEAALVDYARQFVVPEDQEMVIREMHIGRVLDQLERHGEHTFYCGVIDPLHGYTRKQLTYRYYDRAAQMILLSRTDVTGVYLEERARQKELQKARELAKTDSLTGLYNYGGAEERVAEALGQGTSGALLFIDLDDFKLVNDTLGHQQGDQLLKKIANVLRLQTREGDIHARVGGDEFVVYLKNIKEPEQALNCAKRICESINRLSLPQQGAPSVSCSIGIAFAPADGVNYAALSSAADRRAYRAKAQGKDRFAYRD